MDRMSSHMQARVLLLLRSSQLVQVFPEQLRTLQPMSAIKYKIVERRTLI